jgi:hypothetical protein
MRIQNTAIRVITASYRIKNIAGPAGPPTRSPPAFAASRSSSRISPLTIALVGHTSSHARGSSAGRSAQKVHFDIFPSAPN